MDDDESRSYTFGIQEQSRLTFKSKSLGTIVPFRKVEYLVIGRKGLIRFSTNEIKETFSYELTAITYIEKYGIYVGVTAHSPEFIIIFELNLYTHIRTGVKTNDSSIFNIIYSEESSTLITAGDDIKTWTFKYIPSTITVVFVLPEIVIEPKATVLKDCRCEIFNPPMFDYHKEQIFINDSNNGTIVGYSLKGKKLGVAINYECTEVKSCCTYNTSTKQFVLNNLNQGKKA